MIITGQDFNNKHSSYSYLPLIAIVRHQIITVNPKSSIGVLNINRLKIGMDLHQNIETLDVRNYHTLISYTYVNIKYPVTYRLSRNIRLLSF